MEGEERREKDVLFINIWWKVTDGINKERKKEGWQQMQSAVFSCIARPTFINAERTIK